MKTSNTNVGSSTTLLTANTAEDPGYAKSEGHEIPRNTRLRLVFSLGIFSVKTKSLMFLSQHRDTQAIFHLLTEASTWDIRYLKECFRNKFHLLNSLYHTEDWKFFADLSHKCLWHERPTTLLTTQKGSRSTFGPFPGSAHAIINHHLLADNTLLNSISESSSGLNSNALILIS